MRTRAEVRLALGVLLAVQSVTALGAIVLLDRMSPAIGKILAENLFSLRAAEDMLRALASPQSLGARSRFEGALQRARGNITEAEEVQALERIEATWEGAYAGNAEARRECLQAIENLIAINDASTRRADARARGLGVAGAWAAVILGGLGMLFGVLASRRLYATVVDPLDELRSTALAARDGDPLRRAHVPGAAQDFSDVAALLNQLLDRSRAVREDDRGLDAQVIRQAVLHLLDRDPQPRALLTAHGEVLASNRAALDRLQGPEGRQWRTLLDRRARDPSDAPTPGLEAERLGAAWLCTLAESLPPDALPPDAQPPTP